MLTSFELALRNLAYRRLRFRSAVPIPDLDSRLSAESRFYSLLLQKSLSPEELRSARAWLDVGCRNWSYAPGVLHACPWLEALMGVECDPGRLDWKGWYRGDHARGMGLALQARTRGRARARFWAGDFEKFEIPTDIQNDWLKSPVLLTHFFPFVSTYPCRKWGLPESFVKWDRLVERSRSILKKPGGWIVSVHHGDAELGPALSGYQAQGLVPVPFRLDIEEFRGLWPSQVAVHGLAVRIPPL